MQKIDTSSNLSDISTEQKLVSREQWAELIGFLIRARDNNKDSQLPYQKSLAFFQQQSGSKV